MILDPDVLNDLKRKHPPARAWFMSLTDPVPACGLAALELLQVCVTKQEQRQHKAFLQDFTPFVWPTEADQQRAYEVILPLRLAHGLGLLDALIAATAIGRGESLATFNVRHFRGIPGLVTVQPYTR